MQGSQKGPEWTVTEQHCLAISRGGEKFGGYLGMMWEERSESSSDLREEPRKGQRVEHGQS